jgi:hypothetical protein
VAGIFALSSEFITVPAEIWTYLVILGVPIAAYYLLVLRFGANLLSWGIVTGVAVVIGFQILGTDVLPTLLESQAWPVLAAGSIYIAYKLLEYYRSRGSEPQAEIVIDAEQGGSD